MVQIKLAALIAGTDQSSFATRTLHLLLENVLHLTGSSPFEL